MAESSSATSTDRELVDVVSWLPDVGIEPAVDEASDASTEGIAACGTLVLIDRLIEKELVVLNQCPVFSVWESHLPKGKEQCCWMLPLRYTWGYIEIWSSACQNIRISRDKTSVGKSGVTGRNCFTESS